MNPTDQVFHDIANGGVAGHKPDQDGRVDISVVLPFCNERDNLPELLDRLKHTLQTGGLSYELILVDDGSTDGGVAFLEEQARSDERIKVLVLSRNFGQHVAATAGIDAAGGSMVVWMDADLQERPEDIPRLVAKLREGFDVVYTRRSCRQVTRWRAALSYAFLAILNRMVGLGVSPDRGCMRMFSAKMAESMRDLREQNRFLNYLMPWAGFRSAEVEIETDARRRGQTKYSWIRLVKFAMTGVTSFSAAPLRISAFCACATILACAVGVAWVLYRYFVHGIGVSGWASLIIAILVLHGVQFGVIAILGEYLGLTYAETKRRPLYFCSRMINFTQRAAQHHRISAPGHSTTAGSPPVVSTRV